MTHLKLLASMAAILACQIAAAAGVDIDVPREVLTSPSTRTRAEVMADFYMWRAAGLEEQTRGEVPPDASSKSYQTAQARYQALLASPQYAAMVRELSEERGPFLTVSAH